LSPPIFHCHTLSQSRKNFEPHPFVTLCHIWSQNFLTSCQVMVGLACWYACSCTFSYSFLFCARLS
jgi:hypothetical protein